MHAVHQSLESLHRCSSRSLLDGTQGLRGQNLMDLHLHIGAHKTATTYLQERFHADRVVFEQRGTALAPRTLFRGRVSPRLGGFGTAVQSHQDVRRLRSAHDAAVRSNSRRLIISDENLLGGLGDVFRTGELYQKPGRRLLPLARQWRTGKLRVMLAVRAYPTFWPSVYSHWVRRHGYQPFDAWLRSRFLRGTRGWADVVAELNAALPQAELIVWRYEDFDALENAILAEILGHLETVSAMKPRQKRSHWGLSSAAVAEMEAVAVDGRRMNAQQVRGLAKQHPRWKGNPPFDPWDALETEELSKRYARDLERIAAMPTVKLITPSQR